MYSKLEEKLMQYEKDKPITNKQELLNAVESILNEESNKENNQDSSLIDEAVDVILTLNGFDVEEINHDANVLADKILNDAHKKGASPDLMKTKGIRIKWLIPIAAILSLMISISIVAYAMGYDLLSMTNETFRQLKEKIWYNNNNSSIIISNDVKTYKSVEELIEKESFNKLLWPAAMDELTFLGDIEVANYGDIESAVSTFKFQNETVTFSIKKSYSADFTAQESMKIGEYDVYLCEIDNLYQADFNDGVNMYTVQSSQFDTIKLFITILEEK